MYPHERSLVAKYNSQSKSSKFAIVAINSDTRESLEKIVKNKTIEWPAFFDGGDTFGPIATRWNVTAWPTLYLLDKKGTIRAKPDFNGEELDEAIKKLIDER